MNTERTYYQDTYQNRLEANIIESGTDAEGTYVVFDQTIFHPQGGGQPDDEGYFEVDGAQYQVTKLSAPRDPNTTPYIIKHYFDSAPIKLEAPIPAIQMIDMNKRALYAQLHSVGHLLSNAVHEEYPPLDGCRGNHFPDGQSFVIFEGDSVPEDREAFKKKIEQTVNEYIQQGLSLTNQWETNPRTIQFGDLPAYPCGGTHVANTAEIDAKFEVRKVTNLKGKGLRISYYLYNH